MEPTATPPTPTATLPSPATSTETPIPEEQLPIVLRKDGTILLYLDDVGTAFLRRPKAGEYRRLRESFEDMIGGLQDLAAEIAEASHEIRTRQDQRRADAEARGEIAPPVPAEDKAKDRELTRKVNEARETGYAEFFTTVLATVGINPPSIGLDDLPTWALQPEWANLFFGHWRAVPSPRGVS